MKVTVYQSTASKEYLCAYRCAACGKINVSAGKFSVTRGGGPYSALAHQASLSAISKKLPAFYDRVNRKHDLGGMNASSKCSCCAHTQEWEPRKKTAIFQVLMTLLFAGLLFGIIWLVSPKDNLSTSIGLSVTGGAFSAFFWNAYGILAQRINGKLLQRRLKARNFSQDLWPVIGDPAYLKTLPRERLEDPRVLAILNQLFRERMPRMS